MARDEVYVNVKSTNIWDEEWEVGGYDTTTGEKTVRNDCFRSKNYISVTPDGTYYFYYGGAGSSYLHLIEYDADKQFIRSTLSVHNSSRQMAANCHYITFYVYNAITYNNDISIALYDGSPVPYMPHDTKGKVWKKANTDVVDMGSLSWTYDTSGQKPVFAATISDIKRNDYDSTDLLCTAYRVEPLPITDMTDKAIRYRVSGGNQVMVIDLDYSNGTTFQTAMTGQKILYPLASPVWTDITSSAMGAALLALETIEETSNTITINNSGVIDMVQYFTPI